jgi:hypothetical protein
VLRVDSTHPEQQPDTSDARPLAPVLAFPPPKPDPAPPPPRPDLVLPLWMFQLIHGAHVEAQDRRHTCIDSPASAALARDLCDACYWVHLYDQIPENYRAAADADLLAGVSVYTSPNPTPGT